MQQKIEFADEIPEGNWKLGPMLVRGKKQCRFRYYQFRIWIPIRHLTKVRGGPYTAPEEVIQKAKRKPSTYIDVWGRDR